MGLFFCKKNKDKIKIEFFKIILQEHTKKND